MGENSTLLADFDIILISWFWFWYHNFERRKRLLKNTWLFLKNVSQCHGNHLFVKSMWVNLRVARISVRQWWVRSSALLFTESDDSVNECNMEFKSRCRPVYFYRVGTKKKNCFTKKLDNVLCCARRASTISIWS